MADTGRRWAGGLVVLALVALSALVAVGLVAFRRDPPPDRPDRPDRPAPAARVGVHPGSWAPVPRPPLAARWGAVGGWTGREVVVVGGSTGAPCLLRCTTTSWQAGGAAYDPDRGVWRPLPPAPYPVGPGSVAATAGSRLVVSARTPAGVRWLRLDTDTVTDRWTDLPGPGFRATALSATDDRVYAVGASRLAVLDPARGTWTRLPGPRLTPARQAVATAYAGGLTLVASGRVLDRWDGERWTRSRVRSPGRVDPTTGGWRRLPPSPGPAGTSWLGLPQTDRRPPTSGNGHVWDDGDEVWVGLGSPTTPPRSYGTVVYADRRIYLVGGLGVNRSGTDASVLSERAWVWAP